MILRRKDGALWVTLQTDHAGLAGELAGHWGRPPFAPPTPPLLLAARHHDDGWRTWEQNPRLDPATRRPYQFSDLPLDEHARLYLDGIDRVAAWDAHAALLVCRHLAGLYQRRFGLDTGGIPSRSHPPEEEALRDELLARLAAREAELREESERSAGDPDGLREPAVWANYKLLQVFDRLSLLLCLGPPATFTLGPVPTSPGGAEQELTLRVEGEDVAVTPYPFRVDPLPLRVAGRAVPDRDYRDDADFRDAFARAPREHLGFTFRSSGGLPASGGGIRPLR